MLMICCLMSFSEVAFAWQHGGLKACTKAHSTIQGALDDKLRDVNPANVKLDEHAARIDHACQIAIDLPGHAQASHGVVCMAVKPPYLMKVKVVACTIGGRVPVKRLSSCKERHA